MKLFLNKTLKDKKGFALVIVTGIITFLGIIIANNSIEIGISRNWLEASKMKRKSYFLALAGIEAAEALIKNDFEEDSEQGKLMDFITPEIDPNEEVWSHASEIAIPIQASDGVEGVAGGMIVDEQSKINLNMLVGSDGYPRKIPKGYKEHPYTTIVKRFFDIMGVDPEIVNNIVDFIDKDNDGTAESDYYELLDNGYEAINSPFDTISELLLVKGIDDPTFITLMGEGELAKKDTLGSPYLTVYPQKEPIGGYKINVNTASEKVLMALHPGIDERVAGDIIETRAEEPFERTSSFINYLENTINLEKEEIKYLREIVDVRSNCFSVKTTGMAGGYHSSIKAVFTRDKSGNTHTIYWRVD